MPALVPLLLAAAWQVMPERCDGSPVEDRALVDAIELELPPAEADLALHVRACEGDAWVVVVKDREHRFDLSAVVPRLQRRTLALLIRELLIRAHAEDRGAPSAQLLADADAARREGRTADAVKLLEQVAARTEEPDAMVATLTLAGVRPPPTPAPERPLPKWEVALAGRLFFDTPVSGAGGLTLTARPWWRLVFSLTGLFSATATEYARVFVGFEVLGAGVRLVDVTGGAWRLGVELTLEGGLAHAHVESMLDGFVGSTTAHGVFGASASVQGQRALSDALALTATLRGGADRGVVLSVLGEPALALAAAFVSLEVGLAF